MRNRRPLWWILGLLTSAGLLAAALAWLYGRARPGSRFAPPDTATPGPSPHLSPTPPPTPLPTTGGPAPKPVSCGDGCDQGCRDLSGQGCQHWTDQTCSDTCGSTADGCFRSAGCVNVSACGEVAAVQHLLSGTWFSRAATAPLGRVSLPARAGVAAIRGYQRWISARLNTHCRFTPSCSAYGVDALRAYGLLAGSRVTVARIRRCTAEVRCGTADPVLPLLR